MNDSIIREIMKDNGLRQTDIARELAVSEAHLSLLMSGNRGPSLKLAGVILAVCRKYRPETSYEELFLQGSEAA